MNTIIEKILTKKVDLKNRELYDLSLCEMIACLSQNLFSSEELLRSCLNRIESINPKLNALIQIRKEDAISKAKEADELLISGKGKLLTGIPFSIKDLFQTKGIITSAGSKALKDFVPDKDATIVERLKNHGAILIAKSNTPELSLSDECDNPLYGTTNNPHDLSRTPGGSSGGAAAAIAAQLVPFDIGSDVGGSVRQPAHFCGICALKPSKGRIPTTGHIPPYGGTFTEFNHIGPMARTIEDIEILLHLLQGPDNLDGLCSEVPLPDSETINIKELKVGYYINDGVAQVPEDISNLIQEIILKFKADGVHVQMIKPDEVEFGGEILVEHFTNDGSLQLSEFMLDFELKDIGEELKGWMEATNNASLEGMRQANKRKASLINKAAAVWSQVDIILAPVAPVIAFKHGQSVGAMDSSMMQAYNILGWPVATLPIGKNKEQMPVGIQVIGRLWNDHEVLALAKHIEKLTGGYIKP